MSRKMSLDSSFWKNQLGLVNRLIIAHEINFIIFQHITPYKMIKMHTIGKNVYISWNFGIKKLL